MKIENQVTSLELAKKLKELGVKQESLFYWWEYNNKWAVMPNSNDLTFDSDQERISSFTVAELGEILKPFSGISMTFYDNDSNKWGTAFNENILKEKINFDSDTEADARAKMLIYLLENNLFKN